MLYLLILTDTELSDDDFSEDFYIGFFESEQQAEETAEYYLRNITGFCDFPCTYRIVPKELKGQLRNVKPNQIWLVQGYDINENLDEINLVESSCCVTKEQAELELEVLKNKYVRAEWGINRWTIGEKEWREGFFRMETGTQIEY